MDQTTDFDIVDLYLADWRVTHHMVMHPVTPIPDQEDILAMVPEEQKEDYLTPSSQQPRPLNHSTSSQTPVKWLKRIRTLPASINEVVSFTAGATRHKQTQTTTTFVQ